MICACGGKCRVYNSEAAESVIIRYRRCVDCKRSFRTHEERVEIADVPKKARPKLEGRARAPKITDEELIRRLGEPRTKAQMARIWGVSRPTAETRLLDLEKRGLIERVPNESINDCSQTRAWVRTRKRKAS